MPFGKRKISGTRLCGLEEDGLGGEGLAEYSVNAKPLTFGVPGLESPLARYE